MKYFLNQIATGNEKTKRLKTSSRISERFLQIKVKRERERERERESYLCACLCGNGLKEFSGVAVLNADTVIPFAKRKYRTLLLLILCCLLCLQGLAQTDSLNKNTENIIKQQYSNTDDLNEKTLKTVLDGNLLVKTNAAYLGAGISNLGLEYSFSQRLSLDVPVVYSPYTIKNSWKIRLFGLQPEIRIWASEQLRGHFAGLHAHVAWYNVAVNDLVRYQDYNGKTPLLGFGLTYGYALRGEGRWGLEFSLGAGYAQLEYDVFHNVPNGAASRKERKNYLGITKIGISLSYKLISKKQQ